MTTAHITQTTMSTDTVQLIEANIAKSKEIVEFDNALKRLIDNRDFRRVIKEGYLEKEAIRLVHLRGDPAFQTPERQASVLAQIDGIGQLINFFHTATQLASLARKSIEADEATREEIMAEGSH